MSKAHPDESSEGSPASAEQNDDTHAESVEDAEIDPAEAETDHNSPQAHKLLDRFEETPVLLSPKVSNTTGSTVRFEQESKLKPPVSSGVSHRRITPNSGLF